MYPQQKLVAQRIVDGKNDYVAIITQRPDLKKGIDYWLIEWSREDLIVEVEQ